MNDKSKNHYWDTKKSRNWPKKSSQKPHNTVCCGERHCDTITRNKQMKVFRPEIWWYTQTKQQRANERASGNCGKCKCSAVCQTLLCANVINRYLWGCAKALGRWSPPSTDLILTTWWRWWILLNMAITAHSERVNTVKWTCFDFSFSSMCGRKVPRSRQKPDEPLFCG